jgi:hypothetical protein
VLACFREKEREEKHNKEEGERIQSHFWSSTANKLGIGRLGLTFTFTFTFRGNGLSFWFVSVISGCLQGHFGVKDEVYEVGVQA